MSEIEFTDAQPEQVDELPAELPVLPLKETVVFPDSMAPLAIGQERSIRLVDDVVGGERLLALVAVRDSEIETPGWDDLCEIGTAALVHKMIRVPDGTLRILVQGLRRILVEEPVADDPYLVTRFAEVPDETRDSREIEALTRNAQGLFGRIVGLAPYLPEELQIAAANVDDASDLCNLVASTLRLKTAEKQLILEFADTEKRLREVFKILNRELEVFELGTKLQSQVQSQLDEGQREFFLRQQLKAIQEELGEGDPEQAEANELRERLDGLELGEEARNAADRELTRLERLPAAAAEYGVIRTYLDWLATYPGRGKLTVTGQLGEVMQESAQAALSWVRSHTEQLELDERWFARHDVHVHVLAGAVPKDGPSAGIAMATAIASLIRKTPVADDVAMTGEITLTGQVLPIGGVREKVLAAQRAGLGRVILPRENEHDLDELPEETRDAVDFVLVDLIEDVFAAAFGSNRHSQSNGRVQAATSRR